MTLKAIKRHSKIFALRQIKSAQTPVLKKSGCGAVTACDDKCRLSGGSGGYHGVINVFLVRRMHAHQRLDRLDHPLGVAKAIAAWSISMVSAMLVPVKGKL
jgi:hypothetical protein